MDTRRRATLRFPAILTGDNPRFAEIARDDFSGEPRSIPMTTNNQPSQGACVVAVISTPDSSNATHPESRKGSRSRLVGVVISTLVVAFLAFDAAGKLAGVAEVKEGAEKLGFPAGQALIMGAVLAICIVVYAIPRTALIGAVGITAYLGGAVTANMRIEAPLFSHILFAVYLGILMWVGLVLRRPELLKSAGLRR
jgi:hypothetical protein